MLLLGAKSQARLNVERARSGRKVSKRRIVSWLRTADRFILAQYYASYSDTIAVVDRAVLEVAMQINAGSIERDCPESPGERVRRMDTKTMKERRRESGRVMRRT